MPSPERVVERVTTTDAVSGISLGVSYRYRHGVYDGVEREFRGFAQVDVVDREADPDDPRPVPQRLTRRWYHVGTELDLSDEYVRFNADYTT